MNRKKEELVAQIPAVYEDSGGPETIYAYRTFVEARSFDGSSWLPASWRLTTSDDEHVNPHGDAFRTLHGERVLRRADGKKGLEGFM